MRECGSACLPVAVADAASCPVSLHKEGASAGGRAGLARVGGVAAIGSDGDF